MADDLELHVLSIEGEGPSPDFVANLRKWLVAEMTETEDVADDELVVAVVLGPDEKERSMTRARKTLLGSAAAAIALIAGFIILSGDGDEFEVETITTSDESTTTTVSVPQEPTITTTSIPEESTTFAGDATPLPRQFGGIEADFYRADNISLPFSFTTAFGLFLQENRTGQIAISNPSSQDPGDLDIVFVPMSVDFDRWLEILDEGLATLPREDLTVDGLDVTRIDIDGSSCSDGSSFCRDLGTLEAGLFQRLVAGSQYEVWVIEQKGEPLLAVIVGISDESDSVWFDVGEAIVLSMEFGDPDPES
ncbi:hypothetical protein JYT71_01120 [Acidimicrobiaceae bacterium AH-315-P05]|nr:hypothetical protein [Acidimicrobiaceae bacterium AH-315-P05]